RADLENLNFLDADDVVEKITNPCTLRRRLQHLGLAIGQDRELDPLLLQRFKAGLYVRESSEAQVGIHQLFFLVCCQVKLEILGRPNKPALGQPQEMAWPANQAAHQAVWKLLRTPYLRQLIAFAGIKLLA